MAKTRCTLIIPQAVIERIRQSPSWAISNPKHMATVPPKLYLTMQTVMNMPREMHWGCDIIDPKGGGDLIECP